MLSKNLTIKSNLKSYEVVFIEEYSDLIKKLNALSKAVILVDAYIYQYYQPLFKQIKEDFSVLPLVVNEELKSLVSLESVLKFFQQENISRSTTIIAIGGGVLQDIAFFAAHIYYRGLEVYFIPTTLLAMCDSCIGAKCGLNFNGLKNQIGAFHAPKKVFIWPEFVASLSKLDRYSGYGEILKLLLISGKIDFSELKTLFTCSNVNSESLYAYIRHSLAIKKEFIEQDEFDTGLRRLLNYGHTFGHALELATNYTMAHGIAVAYGIDIANYIALKKGLINPSFQKTLHLFIRENFFSEQHYRFDANLLVNYTRHDKKNSDDKLNMVLLKEPGELFIHPISFDTELILIINEYISEVLDKDRIGLKPMSV